MSSGAHKSKTLVKIIFLPKERKTHGKYIQKRRARMLANYANSRIATCSWLTVNPLHPEINIYIISLILITLTFDSRVIL